MFKKVYHYSNLLMIMTSIHHGYGAYIYNTPWRLHVLALSIPVLVFNWWLIRRTKITKFLYYTFALVNFIISILLIGLFEGLYNHLLKNILFFSKANENLMRQFFPPSTYVMPNDFWFEFTGISQAIILFPLLYGFIRFIIVKDKNRGQF